MYVGVGAPAAAARPRMSMHNTWFCSVNKDLGLVGSPLDLDARNLGLIELLLQVPPDGDVLVKKLGVVTICEPLGFPVANDADPEADWMYLLSHF